MCEFCVKHGEGKKWYLNTKNYSEDLLSDLKRRKFIKNFFWWIDKSYKRYFNIVKFLPLKAPVVGLPLKALVKRAFINKNWGQVIPIEDIEKILSLANSIVRVPCACRKTTTGKELRMCFLFTLNPAKIGMADIVDQSFFGGPQLAQFEKMEKVATLDFIAKCETKGYFHTIWAHGIPYIGGVCNCDNTGCIPLKMYKEVIPIFFKAEYIIEVDEEKCNGCKACIKVCQFDAIAFDKNKEKIIADTKKCYGCGICQAVCRKNAIFLKDRGSVPEAANLW